MNVLTTSICAVLLSCTTAAALEPMSATITVSGGNLYDYVVIGEHAAATDSYDNAYDTISPGNLNADMGQPFICVIVPQPAWKPALSKLRGDVRSLAKKQEWPLSVTSTFAKGTPLQVALRTEQSRLSPAMALTLKVGDKMYDLKAGPLTIPAPGPGNASGLLVSAEQP
ncbi:hypothetical protein [Geomonas terrae]|uniref:hypothetical protein n=1 Tax=Geomonas terrae TaxID=2562681 RepID=UPI001092DCD0|nr:hypothetical protein [Geomonas terrae]